MKGWAVDTTARNPLRIKDILRLFRKYFDGKIWNEETQEALTLRMISSGLYRPTGKSIEKKKLALRGRTWAAVFNRMGFATAFSGKKVAITPVGTRLLCPNVSEDKIFLKQMIKWQFPSPLEKKFRQVNLRPFVALLYLVQSLQNLSKDEIAIFVFPLTDGRDLPAVKKEILKFREGYIALSQSERETYCENTMRKRLDGSEVTISEARRWLANYRDYADTLMRY